MKKVPLTEAKRNRSALADQVRSRNGCIVITRYGAPAAILLNYEEYLGWKETLLVRSDPPLMKAVRSGLKALKSGKARCYTLEELFR